jgi:class 3 adenylate cyclase/tetratricopeptide (TPR) repeat protein
VPRSPSQSDEPSQKISASDASHLSEVERRQLTVLFCDLVDSTYLSGQLDPEDYHDVIHAYYAACEEVVQQYEGHIAQYLGDGLLVYFGYPHAHEDDARRALLTGLRLLTAIDTLNLRLRQAQAVELAVRIGVHTGLVVVEDRADTSRPEHFALGQALNLASRLPALAAPGTLVVSEVTYQLTQGFFVCEALGNFELRGVGKPIKVYRVVQASEAQSRFDVAVRRGLTPLVGREQELGMVLERWEQVQEGQGHVVMLSGEAGIGKSRLVQVLKGRVAVRAVSFECRCSPYSQGTAFYPLMDLLRQILHWRDDEPAVIRQQKLETFVTQYRLPQAESVSLLAALLSLPLPEDHYPPLTLEPQQQRQNILEMLLAVLVEQTRHQPVVFIVEDLHWSDPSTLAFLDLLIEQGPMVPIFTVLTCRPTFALPWGLRAHITLLTLSRLSRAHVAAMISGVTGGKTLPPEMTEQLVAKTDGVPLFVEELTKTVLESGWLAEDTDHYELRGDLPALEVPATLHDSLMARLDRLDVGKEVAQLAATIGRHFSYDLLRALAPWDDTALQRGLRQLVEAELCYQHGLLPQATYQFKHALIRDTAYDSLLRSRRRRIHGQIARVLEREPHCEEHEPEAIARHFEAAQEIEPAIVYWEQAGHQARQRSANQEAASHFVHAIDLVSSVGNQTESAAERELRLRLELGGQLIACHGNGAPEVEENYERAQALLDRVHNRRLTFQARHGLRTFYLVRGPLLKAKELGEQLLELASEFRDDSLLLQAHRPHGLCLFVMGELEPARYHLERVIELYRADAHSVQRFEYISDPLVLARCNLGWLVCFLGDRERALDQTERAITLAEELNHKHSLAFALSLAASTRQVLREFEATQSLAERLLTLATTCGYPYWIAWAQMLLGWVRAHLGDPTYASDEIQEGLCSYQETGAFQMLPYFLVLLAEVDIRRGEPAKALLHLHKAQRMIEIVGTRFYEAELYRLMGAALVALQDEPSEARHMFLRASDIAARQGNVLLQHAAQRSLDEFYGS